ncbi:hypothetical protein JMJ77_0014426, partial [Colletotrichum scovillei]
YVPPYLPYLLCLSTIYSIYITCPRCFAAIGYLHATVSHR